MGLWFARTPAHREIDIGCCQFTLIAYQSCPFFASWELTALKRQHPRPNLRLLDKVYWFIARPVRPAWKQSLILVTAETVVRWHRTGFACTGA
jgi:hypothetical protein